MFALKIVIDQPQPPVGRSTSSARLITPRLETSIGALYGFRFEYENAIAIGESLTPVTSSRVQELVRQWRTGRADSRSLANDIFLLVVISDNVVALASSISCCRPLYYYHGPNLFCCSTSIRTLNKYGVQLALDERTVPEFLVYRSVVPPRTLYQGVKKLLGGQTVRVDLVTGCLRDSSDFDFMRSSGVIDANSVPRQLSRLLGDRA